MQKPAPKIQRATLAEQIETYIRGLIISDQLGPGENLPSSTDLASEFGVSRSIVREAMKSLQAKGLIEITNGKRARVRPITNSVLVDFFDRFTRQRQEATIELLELRKGIEVQGAILAARRRTDEDLAGMWALVREMEARIGDAAAYLDVDVQVHLAIVQASKNRMLFHLVDSIREALRDTMREGLVRHMDPDAWKRIQDSHVRLVTFIDRQDAEGAGECMATHFDGAIYGILTREPGEVAALADAHLLDGESAKT
jgi:DNA-binding FadR family transcriptional regulator